MIQIDSRFDRSERLFGREGQETLRRASVLVVGAGGLGSPVIQHLALNGVGTISVADDQELSRSNRNRYVGAWHDDPIPGSPKVEIARRLIHLIDPTIEVHGIKASFPSPDGLAALKAADYVIGCVDHDGIRFILNEACLAYRKPLFDLASDVPEPGIYGGRVTVVWNNGFCLHCREVLTPEDVRAFLSTDEILENEARVYGVNRNVLGETGPSVSPINGVVASLGMTELMAGVTGLRPPYPHLEYRAHLGTVNKCADPHPSDCYYCQVVAGQGDAANIERYFDLIRTED